MAREIPKAKSISRTKGKKSPKSKIVAVCEGKNTESLYLQSFVRDHGNNLVKIEPIRAAGVPLTIVQKAVQLKKELNQRANKKGSNSFDKNFEIWAVFDIDSHPNIPQAIDMAKSNKIETAISNPCVEIWFLLFLKPHSSHIHRHALQRELSVCMPKYDPNGSKIIDYDLIKADFCIAKKRAEALLIDHESTGIEFPFGNPSTSFHKLLMKIIDEGSLL